MPGRAVLDWDAFMTPASELAGVAIRGVSGKWPSYARLVRAVVDAVSPVGVVLLGVCTPSELSDWPSGRWLLLDCSDDERRRRLADRYDPHETADALGDAAAYRALGLPTLDTTSLDPTEVARALAARLR